MRACLFLWILLEQTLDFSACEDFLYIQRLEGESVDIDCVAEATEHRPSFLHLRRRFAHPESVLNVSADEVMTADPETERRINISGQLNLRTVTLTLSHLRATDTGLYVCSFSGDQSDPLLSNTAFFLLVKGESCSCRRYSLLIHTITVGVSLLLLSAIALFVAFYKKPDAQPECQTTAPIYEDMSSAKGKGSSANRYWIRPSAPEASATMDNPQQTNVEQHHKKNHIYLSNVFKNKY